MKSFVDVLRDKQFYAFFSVALALLVLITSLPPAIPRVAAESGGDPPVIISELTSGTSTAVAPVNPPVITPEPVALPGHGQVALADMQNPPQNAIGKSTVIVKPDKETGIESSSRKVALRFPEGAVSNDLQVELSEYAPAHSTGMRMLNLFELNAFVIEEYAEEPEEPIEKETSGSPSGEQPGQPEPDPVVSKLGAEVNRFQKGLDISIKHDPRDLRGLDLNTLRLYYLDEETRQWLPVSNSYYDPQTKTLNATIDHFSYYGE